VSVKFVQLKSWKEGGPKITVENKAPRGRYAIGLILNASYTDEEVGEAFKDNVIVKEVALHLIDVLGVSDETLAEVERQLSGEQKT